MDLSRLNPQQHDALLRQVLSCVRLGILLFDEDGKIVLVNHMGEDLLGYPRDELIGRELSVTLTPEDLKYFYPNLLHLARANRPFEGEILLVRKDGERFFAYLKLGSCLHSPGVTGAHVLSIEDIDHQKNLERLLGDTRYEDLIKIANGIAHELRNPLVGIGGFVNRMYKSCQMNVENDKYLSYINNNLRKIEGLVKKVEDLVALPEPVYTRESPRRLFDEAAGSMGDRLKRQGVVLANRIQEMELRLDRVLILKAFSILLENSLDAQPTGGMIEAEGSLAGPWCQLTVRDQGQGIAPDDLPFVFTPFFSTKADGIGIDTALLKRIVECHGGLVEAASRPGQGASFQISFPMERRRRIRVAHLEAVEPNK